MAHAKTSSSSRKKSSSGSSNGSSAASSKPSSRSSNGKAAASRGRTKTSSKSASRNAKAGAERGQGAVASAADGVSSAAGDVGDKLKAPLAKAKGPALTGIATAAGLAGGALLGAKYASRPKKVLGVPIPGTGNGLAKQLGKAAQQLGELAKEVRAAREKAEQVGKAIT